MAISAGNVRTVRPEELPGVPGHPRGQQDVRHAEEGHPEEGHRHPGQRAKRASTKLLEQSVTMPRMAIPDVFRKGQRHRQDRQPEARGLRLSFIPVQLP